MLALLLATHAPQSWWDGGHMLVAEVARQQLTASELATLDGVLADWEPSFPNMSDYHSSAVWVAATAGSVVSAVG